tara:strand:- start:198 stop:389 length:192 start_codon:yes stop_codon:yes gene_type:complete
MTQGMYNKALSAMLDDKPTLDPETLLQLDALGNEFNQDMEEAQQRLDEVIDFEIRCFKLGETK